MKFLNFFKKKPSFVKTATGKEKKEKEREEIKEEVKPKEEAKKEVKVKKEAKKPSEVSIPKPKPFMAGKAKKLDLAWKVLETPHISEKATDLTKQNKYVFRVFPKSNKKEIKKAVEDIYGIDVLDVKTIKIPRKKKMRGRVAGWKKGYKKAIVKIEKGQKIEILPR